MRADKSSCRYSSFAKMIESVSRDDLQEMYEVGRIKYATLPKPLATEIMMEYLHMMFDLEKRMVERPYTHLVVWKLIENNGVYSVIKDNAQIEFYLVEKRYNHSLKLMKLMLARKLSASKESLLAHQLVRKIMKQVNELEEILKKR